MSTDDTVRTAVVFVHGLLERRPMDVLDSFAKVALTPSDGRWEYYPQPLEDTDSYEARRYTAPSEAAELFEYDWSFLMTSSRYAGFAAALARVFLRRPRHVPDQVFGIWRAVWLALLIPTAVLVTLFVVGGYLLHTGIPGWILGVVSSVVVLSIAVAVFRMLPRALTRSFLTTGFVNVARYFDPAPGSHAARRAIRAGLVDLLSTLHQGRYARIVVVGHGLGGYIAYDALMTLWAETHELHAEPAGGLESLAGLEAAADRLRSEPTARDALTDFRAHQFALWQDLRRQGNPGGQPISSPSARRWRWPTCSSPGPGAGGPGRLRYSARVVRPAHPQGSGGGLPTPVRGVAGGRRGRTGALWRGSDARRALHVRRHPLDQPVVSGAPRQHAR